MAIASSFLPWLHKGSFSNDAWDIGAISLFTGRPTATGLSAGLLILPAALVAVPLFTKRGLAKPVMVVLGSIPIELGVLAWRQASRAGLNVEPGLIVSMIGGALIAYEFIIRKLFTGKAPA